MKTVFLTNNVLLLILGLVICWYKFGMSIKSDGRAYFNNRNNDAFHPRNQFMCCGQWARLTNCVRRIYFVWVVFYVVMTIDRKINEIKCK